MKIENTEKANKLKRLRWEVGKSIFNLIKSRRR